jgi:hypothetical protein
LKRNARVGSMKIPKIDILLLKQSRAFLNIYLSLLL